MTLKIGSLLLDRYQIEEVIAQGGMGAIYRASDQSLGISVAIKENLYSADDSSRQFRREANILATLRHPNLPRVTDHFVIPEQGQYLVMDYIDGEDLRTSLDKHGPLQENEAIRIGISICDALSHLHNRTTPVVHRDIKPGNIKFSSSGQVYLVDFGLAKFSHSGVATTTGAQALTPGYAPPEQYGQGTEPRSDIYSLGASLYAILTDKLPEDGLARAMGNELLTPIRDLNHNISEKFAAIIEKAMAVKPEERFSSADEFKQALLEISPPVTDIFDKTISTNTSATMVAPQNNYGSQPMTVTSPGAGSTVQSSKPFSQLNPSVPNQAGYAAPSFPQYHSQPYDRKSQKKNSRKGITLLGGGIAALVLLGICALGGFFLWNNYQNEGNTVIVDNSLVENSKGTGDSADLISAVTASPSPALPTETLAPTLTPESTLTFTPAYTPVGGGLGKIAFASVREGLPQIYLMSPDGNNIRKITNLPDGACQPDWSPDGMKIVFISPCKERKDIYKGTGLFIVNADGSGVNPLITVPGGDYEPDWSPDGNRIAFTSIRDGISHIYVLNLSDNMVTLLSSPTSNDRRAEWSPDGTKIAFETTRLGNSQVWVMSDSGKGAREFANLNNGASFMPTWSSSGEFISFVQGTDLPWLTSREYNKSAAPEIKLQDLRSLWNPQYSPDNFWYVFEYVKDGNLDIYLMTISGGSLTRLTDDPGTDFHPAWQPVGK